MVEVRAEMAGRVEVGRVVGAEVVARVVEAGKAEVGVTAAEGRCWPKLTVCHHPM